MTPEDDQQAKGADFRVVRLAADIRLLSTAEAGLQQPLRLPTQSIVFRFLDGELAGDGTVAVIDVEGMAKLEPGSSVRATVTFPDAPPKEDLTARRFELWHARAAGDAQVIEIQADDPPAPR